MFINAIQQRPLDISCFLKDICMYISLFLISAGHLKLSCFATCYDFKGFKPKIMANYFI